jgi:hypothetical protein
MVATIALCVRTAVDIPGGLLLRTTGSCVVRLLDVQGVPPPRAFAEEEPSPCWEDDTAAGVRMKSTESDATEAMFVVGKSSTYGQEVEGLPWGVDTARGGAQTMPTVSDATVAIFAVGRSSTCGQEAAELLSEEAGAIGGVQMRAIAGFATGATFVAGRSSR